MKLNTGSVFLALLLSAATWPAHAVVYCVTNGAQLDTALAAAASNGQADVIRLATGTYTHPMSGTLFKFDPIGAEQHDIELSGGWTQLGNNPCGQLPTTSRAIDTIITSNSSTQLMRIRVAAGDMDVTVRRLTFLGGDGRSSDVGGLEFAGNSGNNGTFLVDQCAFIANKGGYASALRATVFGGTIRLRNSLFVENDTALNTVVGLTDIQGGSGGIYVTNNTIVDNGNAVSGNFAGLYVFTANLSQAFIANNNIWNNQSGNLVLGQDGYRIVRNNNLQTMSGTPDEASNNLGVTPVYQPGNFNYTPAAASPLVDAGIKPPTFTPIPVPFDQAWSTGNLDVFSRDRTQGARIDIGAYESSAVALGDPIFADGFE